MERERERLCLTYSGQLDIQNSEKSESFMVDGPLARERPNCPSAQIILFFWSRTNCLLFDFANKTRIRGPPPSEREASSDFIFTGNSSIDSPVFNGDKSDGGRRKQHSS